jgi:hypothetical protein
MNVTSLQTPVAVLSSLNVRERYFGARDGVGFD